MDEATKQQWRDEFRRCCDGEPVLQAMLKANGQAAMEELDALKIACVYFVRQRDAYRKYINIPHLNNPAPFLVPTGDSRHEL